MSSSYLGDLAFQIPLLVVFVIGFVMVLSNYRRYPRPSLLALLGLIALLFNSLIMALVSRSIIQNQAAQGWSAAQVGYYLSSLGFVRYAMSAIGIGLLLFAVYSARYSPPVRRAERVRDRDFPFDCPGRAAADVLPTSNVPDTGIREQKP